MKETCKECYYFELSECECECRRKSPVPTHDYQREASMFPETKPEWGCGEFKMKRSKENKMGNLEKLLELTRGKAKLAAEDELWDAHEVISFSKVEAYDDVCNIIETLLKEEK